MLTKNQKNFRKEMKEYENQSKRQLEDTGYSYIHRDFVANKRWSAKRKTTVSVSSIIAFLFIGYSIYTHIMPMLPKDLKQAIQNSPMMMMLSSQRQKVYNDMQSYDPYEKIAYEVNTAISKGVERTKINAEGLKYFENSQEKTEEITQFITQLKGQKVLFETETYKAALVQYLTVTKVRLEWAIRLKSKWNLENVNAYNESNENVRLAEEALTKEMLRIFDQVGITYEVRNGKIEYSLQ